MASAFGPSALLTPANAVTIARLVLTPLWLIVVIRVGPSWPSFLIGFLLAASDGFDGWIARKQGTTSSGAFLDPLADKFLVLGGLATLVAKGLMWWVPVTIIAVREVTISLYRSYASRRGISVPARWWAKVKTVVQELTIGVALLPLTTDHRVVANAFLWAGVVLAVVTGAQYLLDAGKQSVATRPPAAA